MIITVTDVNDNDPVFAASAPASIRLADYSVFQMLNFGMFIGGTFGMQPHVLQKIFVARSDAVLRKSKLMMFLASLVVIPPMLYVGIVHGAVLSGTGTSLSGSISTISTVLSWVCVGIPMCGAMPSPVCA